MEFDSEDSKDVEEADEVVLARATQEARLGDPDPAWATAEQRADARALRKVLRGAGCEASCPLWEGRPRQHRATAARLTFVAATTRTRCGCGAAPAPGAVVMQCVVPRCGYLICQSCLVRCAVQARGEQRTC